MRTLVFPSLAAAAALTFANSALAAPVIDYAQIEAGAVLQGDLHARGSDVFLGPVDLREDFRRGYLLSTAAGRQVGGGPLAVEAEALYLNDAVKSDDLNAVLGTSTGLRVHSYGALANVKIEPKVALSPAGVRVAPFAAVGVGYGRTSVSILGDPYAGDGMLWQAKAGLSVQQTPAVTWVLAYRYLHIPTFDTNKLGLDARLSSHAQAVTVGLRYTFTGGR